MSLINQVLKDLDQQRGPADGLQVAALQGIGLVRTKQTRWPVILTASALGVTLVVSGFVLLQYSGSWTINGAEIEVAPAVDIAPVATTNVQPITLEIPPEAVTTPAPSLPVESIEPPTQVSVAIAAEEPPAAVPVVETSTRAIKTLSPRQRAEHAFAAAQKANGKHDKARAEQLFNSALDYQPQHIDARIQLAAIYLERSNTDAARQLLEEGLSLDPTQAQLARLYAQLLATRGEYDKALAALAGVTDTQSPDAESLALRAAVYERLKNYADAASSYRLALKLDPRQANWWMGLGLALEHQELYSGAADAYQKADSLPLADNVKTFVRQRLQQLQNTAGDN